MALSCKHKVENMTSVEIFTVFQKDKLSIVITTLIILRSTVPLWLKDASNESMTGQNQRVIQYGSVWIQTQVKDWLLSELLNKHFLYVCRLEPQPEIHLLRFQLYSH